MMMMGRDMFANLGSTFASCMFMWAMFKEFFPPEVRNYIAKHSQRLAKFFHPYIEIKFNELTGEHLRRSEAYSAIETYLSTIATTQATRLRGDIRNKSNSLALTMDDNEEIADEYNGVKLWWASGTKPSSTSREDTEEQMYYKLTFNKQNRDLIIGPYLNHVLTEGKAIKAKNRRRKLYTNNSSWWSHVDFEHPASFEILAMEPEKKKELTDDLLAFSKAKEFYKQTGRAWKRGYLLYGPPGTGKSTMVAAMANFLNYDLYDLELTAVRDNTELRKLLIDVSSKSIIVIEDIDCSVDFTCPRRKKKDQEEVDEEKNPKKKSEKKEGDPKPSKVTLSGLLNVIDGVWSACGGERLIVFTTNHVEKLDQALIRRGRMDRHIELSYCKFGAFKVLAKNYLNVESHHLFGKIGLLLNGTNMTPADVAENLMPKTIPGDAGTCLENLVQALEMKQVEANCKVEEKKEMMSPEEGKPIESSEERESNYQKKGDKFDELDKNG